MPPHPQEIRHPVISLCLEGFSFIYPASSGLEPDSQYQETESKPRFTGLGKAPEILTVTRAGAQGKIAATTTTKTTVKATINKVTRRQSPSPGQMEGEKALERVQWKRATGRRKSKSTKSQGSRSFKSFPQVPSRPRQQALRAQKDKKNPRTFSKS